MRGPKDGTGSAVDNFTSSTALWWHSQHDTPSRRTSFARILPSVTSVGRCLGFWASEGLRPNSRAGDQPLGIVDGNQEALKAGHQIASPAVRF